MERTAPLNVESLWLTSEGRRIHARCALGRAGAAVVLVHGLGVSSRYMVPLLEQLAPFGPVYAPDLPGFGKSDRPRRTLTIGELARSLIEWLDAAEITRAAFLGNSLGAQIIVEAALQAPHRISHLILVGPTVDARARSAPRQIFRLMRDGLREPLSMVGIAITDYLQCSPLRLWRTLRFAIQDRIEDKLPRVTCPALVVRGVHDPLVPEHWAEQVVRLLPEGHLLVMPGTHAVHYARAEVLRDHLRSFLAGPACNAKD